MKEKVEVVAIQMDVAWMDPARNRQLMLERLHQALNVRRVELVVFPELASSGYVKGRERAFGQRYLDTAELVPGPTTEVLGAVARERGLHIVVGICEAHPEIPGTLYNSAALIGPSGEVLGVHRKMHLPGEEKHYFCEGNTIKAIKTELGTIGISVCYDTLFPELTRSLALQGAEILCAVFAQRAVTPLPVQLGPLAAIRASENKCFAVFCNRVGQEDETVFHGHSVIAIPTGDIVAQSHTRDEEMLFATLERTVLIQERAYSPVFRDRRPEAYGILTRPL